MLGKLILLGLIAVAVMWPAAGARVKKNANHALVKESLQMPWLKGRLYACAQKWVKAQDKFTGHYCLVSYDEIDEAAISISTAQRSGKNTPMPRVAPIDKCKTKRTVKGKPDLRMKLCVMKGKEDKRVSYGKSGKNGRMLVPQACFAHTGLVFYKGGKPTKAGVLEAALDAKACRQVIATTDGEMGFGIREARASVAVETAETTVIEEMPPAAGLEAITEEEEKGASSEDEDDVEDAEADETAAEDVDEKSVSMIRAMWEKMLRDAAK